MFDKIDTEPIEYTTIATHVQLASLFRCTRSLNMISQTMSARMLRNKKTVWLLLQDRPSSKKIPLKRLYYTFSGTTRLLQPSGTPIASPERYAFDQDYSTLQLFSNYYQGYWNIWIQRNSKIIKNGSPSVTSSRFLLKNNLLLIELRVGM